MPILDKPKIDDVDPDTGRAKFANYGEYEEVKDAWNRQEAIREFQNSSANRPNAKTSNETGGMILGLVVLALLGYGIWAGVCWVAHGWGYTFSPEIITADGESYLTCDGAHVSTDGTFAGEQVYTVSFSQAQTGSMTLRGIHKLTITDAPKDVCASPPPTH